MIDKDKDFFRVLPLEGKYFGVFIVNRANEKDRYLLTSPLDNEKDAINFKKEMNRIVYESVMFGIEKSAN